MRKTVTTRSVLLNSTVRTALERFPRRDEFVFAKLIGQYLEELETLVQNGGELHRLVEEKSRQPGSVQVGTQGRWVGRHTAWATGASRPSEDMPT